MVILDESIKCRYQSRVGMGGAGLGDPGVERGSTRVHLMMPLGDRLTASNIVKT
jgi:hypothetical protein